MILILFIRGKTMNLIQLDEMISYVEEHLQEPINYKKLSKIVGLPPYILQRIFQFIVGISITEYIRKRRLSKAYEQLKKNNSNITEIAFDYCYSSSSSFSRAFKKYFHILPKEVKTQEEFVGYPKLLFSKSILDTNYFRYQVTIINTLTLYGKKCEINDENYISQIYQLYSDLEMDGLLDIFKENIWYGVTIEKDGKEYYFVGSTKYHPALEILKVPELKYITVNSPSDKQHDIVTTEIKLLNSYLPATEHIYFDNLNIYELEIYNNNHCTVALPIY